MEAGKSEKNLKWNRKSRDGAAQSMSMSSDERNERKRKRETISECSDVPRFHERVQTERQSDKEEPEMADPKRSPARRAVEKRVSGGCMMSGPKSAELGEYETKERRPMQSAAGEPER